MKKIVISLSLIVTLLFGALPVSQAEEGFFSWLFTFERRKGVKPVNNATYNEECGSCHFAYQPGLLPEASWQKLLTRQALAKHFGENAELDEKDRQNILNFAIANSADKSRYKRSKKVMVSLDEDKAPIRITEVPYIKEKHEDVRKEVKNIKKVKSMSLCDQCHKKAKHGVFDDDTVVIPEYGRWTW